MYIAACGVLGVSLQIAAANDILFFCSFGLLFIYSLFALLYNYMVKMISTLLKLFWGSKYNTLRKRDDDESFDIAELFMGVLISALSVFLLRTIAIFYFYSFISVIMSVMVLQLGLIVL